MSRLVFFQVNGEVVLREMPDIAPKRVRSTPHLTPQKHKQLRATGLRGLHRRYDGACIYCHCLTIICETRPGAGTPPKQATREHLMRRVDGGTNRRENIALACFFCNTTRGARSPAQHRQWIDELKAAGLHPNFGKRARVAA